ncbi:MAG TPA: adenylosuccinate lyase [Candidatus Baltobacteraceae bacterium]|jgi:adenylosuccinate lyase|nr:adenylosuccinate lyase [Candidatus Baltobacteraceae bacterium]
MDHATYASPFSWRYGRAELRSLFSEKTRRRLWRAVWVALAEAQSAQGLISKEEVATLRAHASGVDVEAAIEIEREIHHDLMAEIRVFAQQAGAAGGKLHLGATSMDVEDTVETYRLRLALSYLGENLSALLATFAAKIRANADLVCMALTHLQPAEPTTLGYRLASYAQDLLIDDQNLRFVFENLTTKGLRGAVGTAASYERLGDQPGASAEVEAFVLERFGLQAREISTQTYPRKLDYLLLSALAGLGASLSKFAADVRILSSPYFGELGEPFGASQVGSSAMPFKQNPILSERIGSLARLLPAYGEVAWQNAATNFLERTLDDSANRRTILPEAILCADEIVTLARRVVDGLRVDERRIAANLRIYAPFAGTQAVMLEAARAGGDRQQLHEAIRNASMEAWDAVRRGEDNPLSRLLTEERELTALVDPAEIRRLLDPGGQVGTASQRARLLADRIESLSPFPRQPEVSLT